MIEILLSDIRSVIGPAEIPLYKSGISASLLFPSRNHPSTPSINPNPSTHQDLLGFPDISKPSVNKPWPIHR
jgi:hypothetical protein